MKKWAAVAAPMVTASAAAWVLFAAGGSSGSQRPIHRAPPSTTPSIVRLRISGHGRLIRDLTVSVCGGGASCPAYAFPPIPSGAAHLSVGEVLVFRVTRRVPLVTVAAQAPMRGLPGSTVAHAPPAPPAPRQITLARRRATSTVRVRLPRAIAGPQWILLTLSYAAGTATVTVPVRITT